MKNLEFKNWIQSLINDDKIKSIEIIKWVECGEYDGEDSKPTFKIEKFNVNEYSILTKIELEWLKGIVLSFDNHYGFELKDIEIKNSIYKKLNIIKNYE